MSDNATETVGIFETLPSDPALASNRSVMLETKMRHGPTVHLILDSSGGQDRLYLNEVVALRDDATPSELIDLRRRLRQTIQRFNAKEQADS